MKHAVYKTAVAIVAMMAAGSFASAGAATLGASTGNDEAGAGRDGAIDDTPTNASTMPAAPRASAGTRARRDRMTGAMAFAGSRYSARTRTAQPEHIPSEN